MPSMVRTRWCIPLLVASCNAAPDVAQDAGPVADARVVEDSGAVADGGRARDASSRDATPEMDGGDPDAGPEDAAPPPDGGEPGSIDCTTTGLLFCEDFEGYPAGQAASSAWSNHTASGSSTLTIDDDPAHARGARSLHVHADQNQFAYIQVDDFAPPDNSFYGRIYAWVDAFPTAPPYAHWTMVETGGQPSNLGVIRPIGGQYDPQGGAADWGVGSDGGPTGDWTNWNPAAPAVSGRWLCLEWEIRASDTSIRVWIDGTAHPELTVDPQSRPNLVFPTFDRVWFGWWLYQSGPTPDQFDVWLDDVVLSTTRVGC